MSETKIDTIPSYKLELLNTIPGGYLATHFIVYDCISKLIFFYQIYTFIFDICTMTTKRNAIGWRGKILNDRLRKEKKN